MIGSSSLADLVITQKLLEHSIDYCSQIFIANIVHKSQISIAEWRSTLLFVLVAMMAFVNNRIRAEFVQYRGTN